MALPDPNPRLCWDDIDTVLVDMDGTLLDLAFDNYFWLELVPSEYARLNGLDLDEARGEIVSRYERVVGRLEWYCLDHWSGELGLDLGGLKWSHRHLIGYLPGAAEFLDRVRARGKALRIVTNAHPRTISVKAAQTGVHERVDEVVCSHALGAAKESGAFWDRLAERRPFDPGRTLLVEDSLGVLSAARAFGIGHTVAITKPDSGKPARRVGEFRAVERIADLI